MQNRKKKPFLAVVIGIGLDTKNKCRGGIKEEEEEEEEGIREREKGRKSYTRVRGHSWKEK